MCVQLARGFLCQVNLVSTLRSTLYWGLHVGQYAAQRLQADSARSQDRWHTGTEIEHGRFHSYLTWATIQDERHPASEISKGMLGRRGADVHETVGTRRGNRRTKCANKRQGDRMAW